MLDWEDHHMIVAPRRLLPEGAHRLVGRQTPTDPKAARWPQRSAVGGAGAQAVHLHLCGLSEP